MTYQTSHNKDTASSTHWHIH